MGQFREILEALPDGVLIVDEDGVVCGANRNVEDVLGYSPAELRGTRVERLLRERDRDGHVEHRQEYFESPEPRPMGQDLDLTAVRADGTEVPVEIGLGPIESDGSQYVVAVITDASERKERERNLEAKTERLEEFAGVISHDLRNPLNVAIGRLALVDEECDSDHLEDATHALGRMESLIDDLLVLAHQGESAYSPEPVDLVELLEGCWTVVETAGATLEVDLEGSVLADRGRLAQVFENLFRNAVEHGSPDAGVTVSVGSLPGGFFVEDDGPGIPPDERDHVFESGYTTGDDGTGLGLPIVAKIADAHGWDVSVTEGEDGGARFVFTGVEFLE